MREKEIITRFKLLLVVSLILIYTSILTSVVVWRNNITAYLITVLASFFAGPVLKRIEDLITLTIVSYIVAAFATIFMIIAPALFLTGSAVQVQSGILGIGATIIYNSFFIGPLAIVSALVGLFISDSLSRMEKT